MASGRYAGSLAELGRFFLWLGTMGFGGPIVHLTLLEEHAVRERRWLTSAEFLELLGLTNLIPGPNSTEMAMAIGYRRAGFAGLLVAGACFILPAACLTLLLAWLYVRYGSLPWLQPALRGLAPAVLVVMAVGAWRLGREALTATADVVVAVVVCGLALGGVSEFALLVGGAAAGVLMPLRPRALALTVVLLAAAPLAADTLPQAGTLADLGAFFLQVGAVLYGGGYMLVAFLQGLVDHQGWLTQRQLLDAVAAGQVTPGPVLTTATFVGFLIGGPAGAVVATVAIFLPAFVFTSLLGPLTPWLRRSNAVRRAVRMASVAAVAIVAAVTVTLAMTVITSPWVLVPVGASALVAARGAGAVGILIAGMFASALVAGLG
jgi:chromate transporter